MSNARPTYYLRIDGSKAALRKNMIARLRGRRESVKVSGPDEEIAITFQSLGKDDLQDSMMGKNQMADLVIRTVWDEACVRQLVKIAVTKAACETASGLVTYQLWKTQGGVQTVGGPLHRQHRSTQAAC